MTRVSDQGSGPPAARSSWRARWIVGLLLAAVVGDAAAAQGACDRPDPPEIPDGHAASLEEMQDAGSALDGYTADMDAYLDCLADEDTDAATELEQVTGEWDDAIVNFDHR